MAAILYLDEITILAIPYLLFDKDEISKGNTYILIKSFFG